MHAHAHHDLTRHCWTAKTLRAQHPDIVNQKQAQTIKGWRQHSKQPQPPHTYY